MKTSLSYKIEFIILCITLTLGAVLGGLFFLDERRTLNQQLNRRIQVIGEHMAEELSRPAAAGDPAEMNRGLQAAALDPEINYVIVQTIDGDVLASRGAMMHHNIGVHEYAFPLRTTAGARMGFLEKSSDPAPPRPAGNISGRLSIGVDLAPFQAEIHRLVARILRAVLLAIAISVLAAHGLVWAFIRRTRAFGSQSV